MRSVPGAHYAEAVGAVLAAVPNSFLPVRSLFLASSIYLVLEDTAADLTVCCRALFAKPLLLLLLDWVIQIICEVEFLLADPEYRVHGEENTLR